MRHTPTAVAGDPEETQGVQTLSGHEESMGNTMSVGDMSIAPQSSVSFA